MGFNRRSCTFKLVLFTVPQLLLIAGLAAALGLVAKPLIFLGLNSSAFSSDILCNLLLSCLVWREGIVAFGEKHLLNILLRRVKIYSRVSFLEVLADEGAEKHLRRVSSTFLPSERLRLVKEGGEEVSKGGTVGDSFDEHLVLLVWIAVGMLVLEV